jgi:hypothetical protein
MSDTAVQDEVQEQNTTEATQATEATEATTTAATSGGARPRPTYAAAKVAELPKDLKLTRSGPRTDPAFIEALQVCQGDPGEWYEVATFQSQNGAKTALKSIEKKERKIPAGQWDFEARRVEAPTSTEEAPVRWSKLYAKYLG